MRHPIATMASEPMLYEMHMHTPLCKHARGEPEEYAEVALHRGLKGIVVTDHNPTDDGWSPETRMGVDELDDYVAMVERARKAWAGRVDVRLGMESDYVPGMEPWLEKLHGMAAFHHVLGSVHPQLPQYLQRFYEGDVDAYFGTYFEHLARAAETGLFDTIAHPDLVKNFSPSDWRPERAMDHILPCLDRIAATGVAMELNTSGPQQGICRDEPGAGHVGGNGGAPHSGGHRRGRPRPPSGRRRSHRRPRPAPGGRIQPCQHVSPPAAPGPAHRPGASQSEGGRADCGGGTRPMTRFV